MAARAASVTHGHPSGYPSAGTVAATVRLLMEGSELTTATRKASEILSTWRGHHETSETVAMAVELARQNPRDHVAAIRKIGEGWVGEAALAIALYRCRMTIIEVGVPWAAGLKARPRLPSIDAHQYTKRDILSGAATAS
jgi:ADP-ribosylglycohydrolase